MAMLPGLLRPMADGSEEGGESEPEEQDPEVVPSPLDEHVPFQGNLYDKEARYQVNIFLFDLSTCSSNPTCTKPIEVNLSLW